MMSAGFDALHEWFAIGPGERPPTHYRLLNLAPFESNPQAIENQARLVLGFLEQQRPTLNGREAEQIIALVQRARAELLDPARKAAYDRSLRGADPFGVQDDPFAARPAQPARPTQPGAAPYSIGPARPSPASPSYSNPMAPSSGALGGAPNPYAPAQPDPNGYGMAPAPAGGGRHGGSLPSSNGLPTTKPNPYQAPSAPSRRERPRTDRTNELAARSIRLVAAVVEVLCHAGISLVLAIGSVLIGSVAGASGPLFLLAYGAVIIGELSMLCGTGQSFGKMVVGIKIVTEEGEPPGFVQAILLRVIFMWVIGTGLFFIFPPLTPLFYLCNLLSIFGDERRCLHDYLASTRVVYA